MTLNFQSPGRSRNGNCFKVLILAHNKTVADASHSVSKVVLCLAQSPDELGERALEIKLITSQAKGISGYRSLFYRAIGQIETGQYHAVVLTNITTVCDAKDVVRFVHVCIRNATRCIEYGSDIDTNNDDWQSKLSLHLLTLQPLNRDTAYRLRRTARHRSEHRS